MNSADITLLVFLCIGAYSGYKDGFLLSLFSVVGILLGILGGFKLMGVAIVLLDQQFAIDENVLPYAAFGVVFLLVVVGVSLLGRVLKASIDDSFLGRADQVVGAFLGIFKTAFMLSVLLWIVHSLELPFFEHWTHNSWVYSTISTLAPSVATWAGEYIPFLRDTLFY